MSIKNYYEILGISPNADPATIKLAYQKLAQKYHPDKCNNKTAEQKFKKINEAYAILSNEKKRVAYNKKLGLHVAPDMTDDDRAHKESILDGILRSAERGDAAAQCKLAAMYEIGEQVPQDDREAVKWYCLSAEQGYSRAQIIFGLRHEDGKGMHQDKREAVKWYLRAFSNEGGWAGDPQMAWLCLKSVAKQGDAEAQFYCGDIYENQGYFAIRSDRFRKAVKWYRRSANQGYVDAQRNLGVLYSEYGRIQKNVVLAYFWFSLAAVRGCEISKEEKNRLREYEMTLSDVVIAQRLISRWKPRLESTSGG